MKEDTAHPTTTDGDAATDAKAKGVEAFMAAVDDSLIVGKRAATQTGIFAFYSEIVAYSAVADALNVELRFFIADRWVCRYSRKRHRKAGRWVTGEYDTHEDAVEAARQGIARFEDLGFTTALRGDPLLVELSAADIEQLEKSEAPGSRHTANAAFEKKYGVLKPDEEWTPADLPPLSVDYSEPIIIGS